MRHGSLLLVSSAVVATVATVANAIATTVAAVDTTVAAVATVATVDCGDVADRPYPLKNHFV